MKQKKYNYPKEIGVTSENRDAMDKLYEKLKDDDELYDYLKASERTTEPNMAQMITLYGLTTVNMMCWVIKNDKFDSITEQKKVKKLYGN